MARVPKATELSSREDFIINQFATFKKLNTIASKLFDLYYVDTNPMAELSPMMRTMVPPYYIDPRNPEHPGEYLYVGKSSLDYAERLIHIYPYVNEKQKYEYDISAWRGLIVKPLEFTSKTKSFRKSKLEPMVVMGERDGERVALNLILREDTTSAKEELVLPFLQLPNRQKVGEENYIQAAERSIYDPCYQYLYHYALRVHQSATPIPQETIKELVEVGLTDFVTTEGDHIVVTKELLPTLNKENRYSIYRVQDPEIDTSDGRYHYIISEEIMTPINTVGIKIDTLVAALQMT